MNSFLEFVNSYGTYIIIGMGVLCIILLIKSNIELFMLSDQIAQTLNVRKTKTMVNRKTRAMVQNVSYSRLRNEADDLRVTFGKRSAGHFVVSQLIPIFPLLGILGTVAGLILGLQEGLDRIQEGLSTAMNTTLWGLVFAIILKIFDTLGPARLVYTIEDDLEEYERKYKDAVDMERYAESEEPDLLDHTEYPKPAKPEAPVLPAKMQEPQNSEDEWAASSEIPGAGKTSDFESPFARFNDDLED